MAEHVEGGQGDAVLAAVAGLGTALQHAERLGGGEPVAVEPGVEILVGEGLEDGGRLGCVGAVQFDAEPRLGLLGRLALRAMGGKADRNGFFSVPVDQLTALGMTERGELTGATAGHEPGDLFTVRRYR